MAETSLEAAVRLAADHFHAQRFSDAESICRQILAAFPNQPETMHLLGIVCLQTNRVTEGIDWIRRIIDTGRASLDVYINLATGYQMAGDMESVVRICQEGLSRDPNQATLLRLSAVAKVELGRLEDAVGDWRKLTEISPPSAEPWSNLGVTYERLGRLPEAEAACRRAASINPNYAPGRNNLAAVLSAQGRFEEALTEHHAATTADPNFARAWITLAHTAQVCGRLEEAAAAAQRAVSLQPANVDAHRNLAAVLQEMGEVESAAVSYEQAANLIRQLLPTLSRSTPAHKQASDLLGQILLVSATLLPQVYQSHQEMLTWRSRVENAVAKLHHDGVRANLSTEPAPTLFALAYHGQDDRAIAEQYGSLMVPPPSPLIPTPHTSGHRIRLGFVSRFFRDHTIGRLNLGLVQQLDRASFEVSVFSVGDSREPTSQLFRQHADHYHVLPPQLPAAREILSQAKQDILFYTDLGMDPVTYSLAFSRLAAVQMTTWGHPVTSGSPAIDYFLSAKALEIPGSQSQYTESLVTLTQLSVYYHRPTLTAPASRQAFSLEADWTLYGCLQMLWKFHPDFDPILAGVLRRDPKGRLLLIRGLDKRWDDQLLSRWQRTMPDVTDRILFLPRMSRDSYLAITSLLDISLDPIHFCGGNTSYEALALNIPVITLPSHFLRGRLTHAMYVAMQMTDCTATSHEDYITRAITLAKNPEERNRVRQTLADRVSILFENQSAVRDLEIFLQTAIPAPAKRPKSG